MEQTLLSIAKSWGETEKAVHTTQELLDWIWERNRTVEVDIRKIPLEDTPAWFYDHESGELRNRDRTFFTVTGFEEKSGDGMIISQPIMLQQELSYLGIICREFEGVMHFLMQAKIEPGNVNKVQISPTIQATRSNFMQKHGGSKPPYLDYFLNADRYEVVVDQIQSEQSSRFYKKRNRNIMVRVEGEEIDVLPSHRWMTLGQIKRLMREDNLVNMDARTVLSCIPYCKLRLPEEEFQRLAECFSNKALFRSVFCGAEKNHLPEVYQYINNRKMFVDTDSTLVPMYQLRDWGMTDGEFVCKKPYPFKVIFCDISIEGREVRCWKQPLFEAVGTATFGLICCEKDGVLKFVVKAVHEVGCFDDIELGPTVQREATALSQEEDDISRFFMRRLESGQGVIFDHLLSEEGGRFYHEQNRNVLLCVGAAELPDLPDGYFMLDFKTLNEMVQFNNVLNIQLRNLLSLLEA